MKKLNEKSKKEQIFYLIMICAAIFALFCISGCGACDNCNVECENGTCGVQVPGCAGCIDCKKSMIGESCINPRYFACAGMCNEGNCLGGCASVYKDGCFGGGTSTESCGGGCLSIKMYGDRATGCYCGDGSDPFFAGCADGCHVGKGTRITTLY